MRRGAGAVAAVVTAVAALSGAGAGTASASPAHPAVVKAVVKEKGFAGYFVTLSKTATSLTASTVFTVPKTSCGKGAYQPTVTANYTAGKASDGAVVELMLGCGLGGTYGDAILSVGSQLKTVKHPLKPGAKVTFTLTITKKATIAAVSYSKKSSASVKGKGGKPTGVLIGAILPDPLKYSPMTFASTVVNKKVLSAYKPLGFESTTTGGKVNGVPTKITNKGKNFAITY